MNIYKLTVNGILNSDHQSNNEAYDFKYYTIAQNEQGAINQIDRVGSNLISLNSVTAEIIEDETLNKVLALHRRYMDCWPTLYNETPIMIADRGNLSFYHYKDEVVSNIRMHLGDDLFLQSNKDKFEIIYYTHYHSKKDGYIQAPQKFIKINVSNKKSIDQIIKDINNRIFKKHEEAIINNRAWKLEQLAKDQSCDDLRSQIEDLISKHQKDKGFFDSGSFTVERGYISVKTNQDYHTVTDAKKLRAIIAIADKARADIAAIKGN